jgi:hypothetical protein
MAALHLKLIMTSMNTGKVLILHYRIKESYSVRGFMSQRRPKSLRAF